jgi:hypothetical protein
MATTLSDEDLENILKEMSTPRYFYQKEMKDDREELRDLYEKDGSVIVELTSGIKRTSPGDQDILGKLWNGSTKDKDGNPIIDKNTGKVKEGWDKFEAKCIIKDRELVYGIGGSWSEQFKTFINAMKREGISNSGLSGTKWKVKCNNMKSYDWSVEYLGKGDAKEKKTTVVVGKPLDGHRQEPPKADDNYQKVVTAIQEIRDTNKGMILAGLDEDELIEATSFKSKVDKKQIKGYIQQLTDSEIIKITSGKIYIQ